MARPERVGTSHSTVNYRGLRDWLEQVEKIGELLKVNGAHWDREMGAITQMLTEGGKGKAPAILVRRSSGLPERLSDAVRPILHHQARRADARLAARIRAQGRHRQSLPSRHDRDEIDQAEDRQERADLRKRFARRQSRRAQVAGADSSPSRHAPLHRHGGHVHHQRSRRRLVQLRRLSLPSVRRENHRLPDHRRQAWAHSPRQIFRARPELQVRHRVRPGPAALHAFGQSAAVAAYPNTISPAVFAANR